MLSLKRAPAPWLAWCLLASVGNPQQRYPEHAGQFIAFKGALGHVAREFTGVSGNTAARDTLPLVIQWVSAERPSFDKPQRRAGWPRLVKQAIAWADTERLREDDRHWAVPLASHQAGDVQCTLIASARGLRLEGLEMRHCADLYVGRCASRRFAMASLVGTGPLQGRRATALFERQGMHWLVRQVRASANREPGNALVEAARSLALAMWAVLSRKAGRVEARYAPQVHITNPPPEGRCPKAMPPNAQLVCQVAWYWSPTSNLTMRYHLCRNRAGTHWVLWGRMLDDDRGRWNSAQACVTLRWRGQAREDAAATMLGALWLYERDHRTLDHYSELSCDGVLRDDELEGIADQVWGP